MRFSTAAALALLGSASLPVHAGPDLGTWVPIEGNWTYTATTDGSEADFANSLGAPQVWVHCTRATRRVTIAKANSAAAPVLNLWTSSATRDVPATFNAATGRLTIELAPFDPLLDAVANSRARIGLTVGALAPLVVPAWAEVAHVIEDCRA
jgi:hypothetical protein